jgi:hypothetical protein
MADFKVGSPQRCGRSTTRSSNLESARWPVSDEATKARLDDRGKVRTVRRAARSAPSRGATPHSPRDYPHSCCAVTDNALTI